MAFSFKKRMLAVTVVILAAVVLLETPWQVPTRQVMTYILRNPWSWENCAAVLAVCLP